MEYYELPAYEDKNANIKLMGYKGNNLKRISGILNINNIWLDLENGVLRIYTENIRKIEKTKKYFSKYLAKFHENYVKFNNPCKKRRIF